MKNFYFAVCLVLASICLLQCKKDYTPDNTADQGTQIPADPIVTALQGNIQDENDQPANGVKITVGNKTAVTDATGYFRISDAALDKTASLVYAEKEGYFKVYRVFAATSGTNQISIKLTKKNRSAIIAASSGGAVTLTDGSKISLAPNSVVIASSGAAYTGNINVYAYHADPKSDNVQALVAGSFVTKQDNKVAALSSFGMLTVELESDNGEKLQIKSGAVASISSPIQAADIATAPSKLSLSYLDEKTGIWRADGTANKQGNFYVGDVSHFSNWSYDTAFQGVSVTLTLQDYNGAPLANVLTELKTTGGVLIPVFTDARGQAKAIVPLNESLQLVVKNSCYNVIYTQSISAPGQNTDLGIIKIGNTFSAFTLTGKLVDCSGLPVKNGLAHFVIDGSIYRVAETDADGKFAYIWAACASTSLSVNVIGTDETTLQKSNGINVSAANAVTDFGSISVCSSSTEQFVKYTLDGVDYNLSRSTTKNDSISGYTSTTGTITTTYISGGKADNSAHIFFGANNVVAAGTYPVAQLGLNGYSNIVLTQPFNVIFTNLAKAPGEFYEGTLSGKFKANNTETVHEISGSFKVLR